MPITRHLVVIAAGVLALAGCGGSTTPHVASVSGVSTTRSVASSTAADPALAYAECMRSHGVPTFPDPTPGGGLVIPSSVDPSSPAFRGAQAKCQKLMPGPAGLEPGTTTHPTAHWLAQMIKAAQCMRADGVPSFPDPTTTIPHPDMAGGGGVISDIDGAVFSFPHTIDMQSPAFVRAARKCGFPLHNH